MLEQKFYEGSDLLLQSFSMFLQIALLTAHDAKHRDLHLILIILILLLTPAAAPHGSVGWISVTRVQRKVFSAEALELRSSSGALCLDSTGSA
ncbi:hypothetical protein QQF64_026333 [Cirrhinus molitorella]|uniref:Secreted protein n=1 Tax=Cirrhinus molitorella TaxID=172907 RepID=A0ABR3N9H5_9TELE